MRKPLATQPQCLDEILALVLSFQPLPLPSSHILSSYPSARTGKKPNTVHAALVLLIPPSQRKRQSAAMLRSAFFSALCASLLAFAPQQVDAAAALTKGIKDTDTTTVRHRRQVGWSVGGEGSPVTHSSLP